MIDPLTQKYLEVLNEGTDKGVVKSNLKTGKSFEGTEDLNKGNEPTENVDLDKPTEDKENSQEKKDGKMEKCKTINASTELNPFESLYNKILSEDSFGWSMDEDEGEGDEASGEVDDFELSDNQGEEDADEFDSGEEDSSGDVTITLDKETAEKLIDILQTAIGGETEEGEEESSEEGEEESSDEDEDIFSSGEEDEENEDELTKEEVDAEIVGHSLVDQEKLLKGMNNPKNNVVKGALSAKKKKANVPLTGKGFKGELTKHKENSGKALQGKNNKVNAVNAGNKTLVDNK